MACVGAMSVSVIRRVFERCGTEEEAKESSPVGLLALFVGSLQRDVL